jgi:hypothetical protein
MMALRKRSLSLTVCSVACVLAVGCGDGDESDPLLDDGAAQARTIDGSSNNVAYPVWGSTGAQSQRRAPAAYGDGVVSSRATRSTPARAQWSAR